MKKLIILFAMAVLVSCGVTHKVSEKVSKSLLDNYKFYDGKYYTLPYGGGVCGIVYNEDLMQGYQIPKTTDELRNLVFIRRIIKIIANRLFTLTAAIGNTFTIFGKHNTMGWTIITTPILRLVKMFPFLAAQTKIPVLMS